MQNSGTVRPSLDANEQARARAKTTALRNEAQLNCVALRSQSNCEVTYGAVKGAPKGAFILTLDSPVSHFTIGLGTKRNAVQLSFVP